MCALYLTVSYVPSIRWSRVEDLVENTPKVLREGRQVSSQEDVDALLAYLRDPFVTDSPSAAEYFLAYRLIDQVDRPDLAVPLSITNNIVRGLALLKPEIALEEGLKIIEKIKTSQRFDQSILIFRAVEGLVERSERPDAYVRFFEAVQQSPARPEYLAKGMFGRRMPRVLREIKALPSERQPKPELLSELIRFSLAQWRYLPSKKEKYAELAEAAKEVLLLEL